MENKYKRLTEVDTATPVLSTAKVILNSNDVIKQASLEDLIEASGVNDQFEATDNKANCESLVELTPVAQAFIDDLNTVSDYTKYGAQSFTVINDLMVVAFTGKTTEDSLLVSYNMLTGKRVSSKVNLKLGHANGMTNDGQYIYIACAGGTNGLNKVSKVNPDTLTIVKDYSFDTKSVSSPYSIAYVNGYFYLACASSKIVKMTSDFNTIVIEKTLADKNVSFTAQTLGYDGVKFCFTYQYNGLNYIDYYSKDLDYVTSGRVNTTVELEGITVYNDIIYSLFNTSHSGIICKMSTINNGDRFDSARENNRGQLSVVYREVYVNTEATNFYVDGTIDAPYRSFYPAFNFNFNTLTYEYFTFYLHGEIKHNINVKKSIGSIYFYGYDGCKVDGLAFRDCDNVVVKDLEVVKRNDVRDTLVSFNYCNYAYLENVKFSGSAESALVCISSNANIVNSNFNGTYSQYSLIATENSTIKLDGLTNKTINKLASTTNYSNITIGYRPTKALLTADVGTDQTIINGTINLAQLTRDGNYRIEANSTLSNAPSDLGSSGCCIKVTKFDYVVYYELIHSSTGTIYLGVLPYNQTTIVWNKIS